MLDQAQLARTMFPVGTMHKARLRELAAEIDLRTAAKPDSQDICFVPDGDYVRFLEEQRGPGHLNGEIVHVSGRVLGRHQGIYRYTIGQRRGLGLSGGPWYVVAKRNRDNALLVAHADALERHLRDRLFIRSPHWIAEPPQRDRLELRIRHAPETVGCRISPSAAGGLEVWPVRELGERYNVLQSAFASAERIFQVLDEPAKVVSRPGAGERPQVVLRRDGHQSAGSRERLRS